MTRPIERDPIYRGRRFQTETIELCVRWYITYRLSCRDLVAMIAERGIAVSHTTIMRWVLRYVPEFEERWNRFARPVNSSWRMDETAVSVRGGLHYLYRAVDKHGKSVASLLRADRGMEAAQEFFRKAVAMNGSRWPTTVNLDGNAASHRALRLLANRIRKRQFSLGLDQYGTRSLKQLWDRALAPVPRFTERYRPSSSRPPTHQNSQSASGIEAAGARAKPLRYPRKIFDGRGLYLLVMPNGGRYWRWNYRFDGKLKTLALGVHPDVPFDKARARHQVARSLLADGVDPSARKRALGNSVFAAVSR